MISQLNFWNIWFNTFKLQITLQLTKLFCSPGLSSNEFGLSLEKNRLVKTTPYINW